MADDVEEMDDDSMSATAIADMKDRQSSRVSRLKVSSTKISEPQKPIELDLTFEGAPEFNSTKEEQILIQISNGDNEKLSNNVDKKQVTPNRPTQPRSACRARSRDTRQCQKHFQEMIGKHETRNDELEQREGDLRQCMEMLECSMPAVMTWNIWRMSQNAPASTVRRLLEKQFQNHGEGSIAVPSTPSQHYDCRVREIEAERKEALRRAEEARVLLAEKEAAVVERRKLLEDAKKCNQERREKMEKLNREAAGLRLALKNARGDDNSCETGECGEIRCRDKWLDNVGSVSSIGSTDLECFTKLQELAEAEICMKRQITELERREEAYMRTLQQADELWLKMEGDTADTVSDLQDQLDSKTLTNQQLADRICSLEDELEKSKMKLIGCKDALSKFTDKRFSDVEIGFDDGEATVTDRGIVAAIRTATASTIAAPTTADQETLALPESTDKESSVAPESVDAGATASAKMFDKDTEAVVDQIDRGVDRPIGLGIDAGVGDEEARVESPEALRSKTNALRRLKRRSSKPIEVEDDEHDEDIPEHWKNWDWDESCPPDAICDDMVESSTGTDDLQHPKGVPTTESKVQATPEVVDQPVGGHGAEDLAEIEPEIVLRLTDAPQQATGIPIINEATDISITTEATEVTKETDGTVPETDRIILSREELRNWYNIVDSVHHMISKCVNCSSKMNDTAQLAERMKLHLRIKDLSGVNEPAILKESAMPVVSTNPILLEEVRKIDKKVDSLSVEVEKTASAVIPETLVSSEAGIRAEVAVDSKPPVETVVITVVSESEPRTDGQLDILDKFAKKSEQQTDTSEEQSAGKIMPVASRPELSQVKPKEISEPIDEDRKTFPEPVSTAPAVPEDIVVEPETKAQLTAIPIDETSTVPIELSEELAKAHSAPKEFEVESGNSKESVEPLQVFKEAETKQPVVREMPVDDEAPKSEVDSKEDAEVEVTAVSFVTPRTPPPSKMDVQFHQTTKDIFNEIERGSESVVESLIKSEELEPAEESSQQETTVRPITEVAEKSEFEIESVPPEIRSPPDENIVKLLPDKVPDKISNEGRIAKLPEPSVAGKLYLSIAKLETVEKVKLPKSLDKCICKPRTCPLLRGIASRESKPKAPKLFTEGTQTSSQIPKGLMGRLDKLKLKTITESTWPSPEVGIWRRPTVWPRRPRDKSTLTTACVDTQTDSALVRERIALEGIDRKDRTTCSGVCPKYTEHGGCSERISSQPRASAGFTVAELFGGSVRFPASMDSSNEKEIAVVKYEGRSLMPQESELYCVECGRPITPDGTPLSVKPSLSTSSTSQKSIMASLKIISSSTSRLTRKKDAFTCCDCKTSDNRKFKENDGSSRKRTVEKSSIKKTSEKEVIYPCSVDIIKIMPKSSKSSKKKRKPEKKDQSVTADIPRRKLKPMSRETRNVATKSIAKMISSSSASNAKEVLKCACDEDSNEHLSLTKNSSVFMENIAKDESSCNPAIEKSSLDENISCNYDCSLIGSCSGEEGICNCEPLTQ